MRQRRLRWACSYPPARRPRTSLRALGVLAGSFSLLSGCVENKQNVSYQSVPEITQRNTSLARSLNEEGLEFLADDRLDDAIDRFREALAGDIYYSPAHNNLGLALSRKHEYYEAAWEFQYAAKLSPHATEPRNNLGLLYESLGRSKKAVEQYKGALEIAPDNLTAMRYLARTYVRAKRDDDDLIQTLQKLYNIPGDAQWDYWIRTQLIRLGRYENVDAEATVPN